MADETDWEREEEFFRGKGFGMTMGFGERPVLIVIDLTNAFTDASTLLGSNLDSQVEQTNRLLDAAHENSIPVIFTTLYYEDSNLRDAGLWAKKTRGVQLLRAGTRMVELDARLHRGPGDALMMKKYSSSFFGTDLVSQLTTHAADTLVIAGCSTSGCVRATAVDSSQYGFRPMIVREAVGDRSMAAHRQSLFDLHSRIGDVVSVEYTLAEFQRHRGGVPAS